MQRVAPKAVVTGAGGFIGSHLVDRLLADGWDVVGIDNFAVGRRSNLSQALARTGFSLVAGDIARDPLDAAFAGARTVFHLAALADIVPSISNPVPYHQANVDGTVRVLEAARQAGVKRFIYAASSSCYGLPDVFPTPESAPPRPMYPYALTKWVAEQYVMHWCRTYDLPSLSLRFFNVFGPRARTSGTYGAVFGVFLAQKRHGQPFTVVGDGTQTRDFTFVSDIVDALVLAAESALSGEIMNVGSGGTYSVNRLVELLGGPFVHIPKRPGEPDCTFADIAKIRRLLGWQPKVSFEAGVARVLEHLEDWRDAQVWSPDAIVDATRDWHRYLSRSEASRNGDQAG